MKKAPLKKHQKSASSYGKSKAAEAKKTLEKSTKQATGKSTKKQNPALARIRKITSRIPGMVFIWLLLILSGLMLFRFNANRAGSFSSTQILEVMFDHTAQISEIQSELDEAGLKPLEVETIGGNILQIRLNASEEQITKFNNSVADRGDITSKDTFTNVSYNPVQVYFPGFLTTLIVGLVLSFVGFLILQRQKRFALRLKSWAIFNTLNLLAIISLAALGVGLSKLQILKLTPQSFNYYVLTVVIVIVVNLYIFNRDELRYKLLHMLRMQNQAS